MLKDRLTVIAIDEAHSISQWGHDFRMDYRKLNIIREIIKDVPILAVTATATEAVRQDIITMVGLNAPRVIITSFDRENLEYIVHRKSANNTWKDLKPWIKSVDGGSIVIFTLRIAETAEIAAVLASHGIESTIYHASLPMNTRSDIVRKFLNNEIKIVVSTIAFAMGIDKPDIRLVIHYGASKNLSSYSQEIGRAGRDGLPAKAITFFNESDFELQEFFLTNRKVPLSQSTLNHLRSLNAIFRQYLYTTKCRRKTILEYFGEDTNCLVYRNNCCDYCALGLSGKEKPFIDQPIIPPNDRLQNIGPYRSHTNMQSIVDMFFGQCEHCDHGHGYDEYSGSEYEEYGYDEYGSYDEAREDDDHSSSSEIETDEHIEPNSDQQGDTDEVVAKRRRIS